VKVVPDTERAPIRILVFSASLRTGSLNTKLANLAAKCIEHNGGQVDLASMSEFDAPSYNQDLQGMGDWPKGAIRFRDRLEWCDALEHGDLGQALSLFETGIDSLHCAGDVANLAVTLGVLAVFFDGYGRPEVFATLYGAIAEQGITLAIVGFADAADNARAALGEGVFEECAATGVAMELAVAVRYGRRQIQLARRQLEGTA
jgi:hypothetical protein